MLDRRSFLAASSAAALTAPALLRPAHAATPRTIAVMVKQIDDIVSFDPAESYEFSNNEIDANCYRRLVTPDANDATKIAGDLAEKWDVSADGKTLTFHLRSGAMFDTGRTLGAEDVAYSFQRVVKLNKTPAFILTQFGFTPENVEKMIRATGDRTVVMELPEPAATSFVLYCLSANVGSIVDKQVVSSHATGADMGNDWLKTRTAGAGDYGMSDFQASDHAILDANPHGPGKDVMRRVVVRHVSDPSAQFLLLQKADADIARNLSADQLKSIASSPDYTLSRSPQARSMYIAMNQANDTLKKPEVVAAVKWAIDYDAIAKNITPNIWDVCQTFLPSCLPGAVTDKPYQKDTAKAKELLAKAGFPSGFEITMDFISAAPYADIAQAIQANLAEAGIKVQLLPGEQKQVITKTRARQHQMAMLVWGSDYFDPNSNAQGFCENPDDSDASKLKILAWRSHFVDPELTKMSHDAVHELDSAKRIAMYQKMQELFMQRSPFAMLLSQNDVAVLRKGVTGLRVGPLPDYTRYEGIKKA
jgi:peptide/nickel transport system substrate-binding protein